MLEAGRDKGRDRQHDRDRLVGDAAPGELIHTAMQTSTLHITPLKNAWIQGSEVFAAAIFR